MKSLALVRSLLTLVSVACLAPALHAAPILSENFDELSTGLGVTNVGVFTAVKGTNVDILGGGTFGYLCVGPESGNCVDLGGSGGDPNGKLFSANLNLDPGTYYLSFDLIGSGRGQDTSTTVSLGNWSQTYLLSSGDITSGIVVDQMVHVGNQGGTLKFVSNGVPGGDGNVGALLDNVSISATPTVTPEPGTLTLLGTGVLSAAGALRRRLRS